MAGTVPISGSLTMQALGDTLTTQEQFSFEQVTNLAIDPTQVRNLVTMISQPNQLGPLSVVAQGASGTGTKVISATVYISGTQTAVDVYRAALGA